MKPYICILLLILCYGCKKNTSDPVPLTNFGNVVILGNSITFAGPDPSIGWMGSWGMAASSAGQDYVHLLASKFKKYNDTCKVQATNIGSFEVDYATFDPDANLKKYRDTKPDLVIIRIGENVPSTFDPVLFATKYQSLISYMKDGNPKLKILAVGSFENGRDYINDIMNRYTPFISLESLSNNFDNFALYLTNVSDAVKAHPGDVGMQRISEMMWVKICTL